MKEQKHFLNIGAILRAIREDIGITQEALADRSKLNRGHISDLELDKKHPAYETIIKLAIGLGMTPAEFTQIIDDKVKYKIIFEKLPEK